MYDGRGVFALRQMPWLLEYKGSKLLIFQSSVV
jgi:hypothetical protein